MLYSYGAIPEVTFIVKVYSPVAEGHSEYGLTATVGSGSVAIVIAKGFAITQPLASFTHTSQVVEIAGSKTAEGELV